MTPAAVPGLKIGRAISDVVFAAGVFAIASDYAASCWQDRHNWTVKVALKGNGGAQPPKKSNTPKSRPAARDDDGPMFT